MFKWVYRISDSLFLYGGPIDPLLSDVGQNVATLERNPKPRTERYDAENGIRAATAEEIAAYDAEMVDLMATHRFDDEKLVKALGIWTAQKLSVPLATARAEILAIYKGL